MKYVIEYQELGLAIAKLEDDDSSEQVAGILYPKLADEITLPVRYQVNSCDGKPIGEIVSEFPERKRISMKNGGSSTLNIDENGELILKANGRKYDVGKSKLEDLLKEEIESQKNYGFVERLDIRSSEEQAKLNFYNNDGGNKRAILELDDSDFVSFLPVIMYDKILEDLQGKTIKKKTPPKKFVKPERKASDGEFVKYVKEHYAARSLEDAFEYQDENGEENRFFEYLDYGLRPIILNGPTGNGKTVLSRHYAAERKLPFYFDTGSSSFRLSTAVGKFVPSPGNPILSPGSLTLAAIHGGVYVLEEMPPIPQDELTGLNIFLETGELPIISQFGHEVITAHPDFRFVATGNFHSNYTTNELNDAFLQRFSQIKMGYPSKDNTTEIIQARADGINYETAETITNVVYDMREVARKHNKDLGLKGAVELAQRFNMGSEISLRELFEDTIVNPLSTYEDSIDKSDGRLYSQLMEVVEKYV